MSSNITIYSNLKNNLFLDQLFDNYTINYKSTNDITNRKNNNERAIIFYLEENLNTLDSESLSDKFLILTNSKIFNRNKNLNIISSILTPHQIKKK